MRNCVTTQLPNRVYLTVSIYAYTHSTSIHSLLFDARIMCTNKNRDNPLDACEDDGDALFSSQISSEKPLKYAYHMRASVCVCVRPLCRLSVSVACAPGNLLCVPHVCEHISISWMYHTCSRLSLCIYI